MLYVYHYDVAAIVATSLALFFFFLRSKYDSKSNRLFFCMIISNLLAAIFDLISCFNISYPEKYALWFNYVVSLGYLLFYDFDHGRSRYRKHYVSSASHGTLYSVSDYHIYLCNL